MYKHIQLKGLWQRIIIVLPLWSHVWWAWFGPLWRGLSSNGGCQQERRSEPCSHLLWVDWPLKFIHLRFKSSLSSWSHIKWLRSVEAVLFFLKAGEARFWERGPKSPCSYRWRPGFAGPKRGIMKHGTWYQYILGGKCTKRGLGLVERLLLNKKIFFSSLCEISFCARAL